MTWGSNETREEEVARDLEKVRKLLREHDALTRRQEFVLGCLYLLRKAIESGDPVKELLFRVDEITDALNKGGTNAG